MSISALGKEHIAHILDGTKIAWYHDRVRAWEKGERIAPITIDMALTRTCNYACQYCVRNSTMILMADYTWRRIDSLKVGELVIGFDEKKPGNGKHAKYYPTKITAVMHREGCVDKIESPQTSSKLFITAEHPLLCEGHRWRKPSQFERAEVRYFCPESNEETFEGIEYKIGYLKGAFEGDGTFGIYKHSRTKKNLHKCKLQAEDSEFVDRCAKYIFDVLGVHANRPEDRRIITLNSAPIVKKFRALIGWKYSFPSGIDSCRGYLAGIFDAEGSLWEALRIAQCPKVNAQVYAHIGSALSVLDFNYAEEKMGYRLLGKFSEKARFFRLTKPAITRKIAKLHNGAIPETVRILKNEGSEKEIVWNIETESHTYVANGYAVHNCYATLQENQRYNITKEVMRDFLDDVSDIGVRGVSLVSDGESTLNPAYAFSITYGYSRGLSMANGTNAYLLRDEAMLKEILPCLTYLRVNITAGEAGRYKEIMGVKDGYFEQVCDNIRRICEIKNAMGLDVTVGLQMVFLPSYIDQVLPLARLGADLGADYLVIKHCSDDETGSLGVNYDKYKDEHVRSTLREAEGCSNGNYVVKVKWSKIEDGNKRSYSRCYGTPFLLQISGSGLVAPCGMLFGEKYSKYHIGNITKERFKDIWKSEKYWEVVRLLASDKFNAQSMCGSLCLQHSVNKYLDDYKKGKFELMEPASPLPAHGAFV